MTATITRVQPEQAAALADLARQTFYDTFVDTCRAEDMIGFLKAHFGLEQVQEELRNPADYYYFAIVDQQPVGFIRFMEDYTSFPLMKQWKALELKRLYVIKEFQGKGIAQRLMDCVLDFATKNKYEVVWLGVWEHNDRAQRFYAKYGFMDSGYTHPFPIGTTPQTDVWWWKFL